VHTFPRPRSERLAVLRTPIDTTCPECGSDDVSSYRALSEGGWWTVVKCQDCLASLERTPAPALGSYVPLGTTVGGGR
jgi:transcription elongation factor Elf1